MKFLISILMFPAGLGSLGLVLAADPDERIPLRLLGALIALIMSPFLLLMGVYIAVLELYEHINKGKSSNVDPPG